ncbi:hypothetical protein CHH80_22115 [Bacillus sp. 7504-2]|nr:hypothetical protein CHH80_22115 [Bacillus sp. 7504-2]
MSHFLPLLFCCLKENPLISSELNFRYKREHRRQTLIKNGKLDKSLLYIGVAFLPISCESKFHTEWTKMNNFLNEKTKITQRKKLRKFLK